MNRRESLAALLAVGAGLPQRAMAQAKAKTLGILTPGSAFSATERTQNPFYIRLAEGGWVEGKTLAVERRYAEGDEARLPLLARQLVERRVDAIWCFGPEATVAAAQATQAIPIVFNGINYPVELGLAKSFNQPGRNVTGITFFEGVGVSTKMFEFLHEIAPAAKRIAGLSSLTGLRTVSGDLFMGSQDAIHAAARALRLEYRLHDARTPQEFEAAFAAISESRAEGLLVWAVPATLRETRRIIEFANRRRLPCAVQLKDQVAAGALLSYGPDVLGTLRQSAAYVDRVLRGMRPADLPIELPNKYELAINMKTANALGLKPSASLVARADEVFR